MNAKTNRKPTYPAWAPRFWHGMLVSDGTYVVVVKDGRAEVSKVTPNGVEHYGRDSEEEGPLVGEVVVQRTLGAACSGQNAAEARGAVSVRMDLMKGRIDQRLTGPVAAGLATRAHCRPVANARHPLVSPPHARSQSPETYRAV